MKRRVITRDKIKSVLLVGNGAREDAIAKAIFESSYRPELFSHMKTNNPGIRAVSNSSLIGGGYSGQENLQRIIDFALLRKVDLIIIGPEEPLAAGLSDIAQQLDIPCVGPGGYLAQLETSKSFTRKLLTKHNIPGNIRYRVFTEMEGVEQYLDELGEVVIKPDGLTGGKGVKVQGEHFSTKQEALAICREILERHTCFVVEEKLDGEEFSLQCFCDGKTIKPMIPVRDHKRRFAGDKGENTGGMGSYSCADHSLPFLTRADINSAVNIVQMAADALAIEAYSNPQAVGKLYQGIMYGGFIATSDGVMLLEFNARFGDPEAMNIFSVLKTDFIDVCWGIVNGRLNEINVKFDNKATVCKYIVPTGYGCPRNSSGANSDESGRIVLNGLSAQTGLFYSSVDERDEGIYLTSSRSIAVVGVDKDLAAAERIAEAGASSIKGPVDYRSDIGKAELISKSVKHMRELRQK